jgi:hypothetical protein
MMDIDQLISKMENDIVALRRARELARQYEGAPSLNGKGNRGANDVLADQQSGGTLSFSAVPEMLKEKGMSIRELETALASKGVRVAYSTIHSWMGRAVKRGEFKKKAGKYRWQEAKDQTPA